MSFDYERHCEAGPALLMMRGVIGYGLRCVHGIRLLRGDASMSSLDAILVSYGSQCDALVV